MATIDQATKRGRHAMENASKGVIFTPPNIVNEMLDMIDEDRFGNKDYVFFEPCCGNGNFVVELYKRQLDKFMEMTSGNKVLSLAYTINSVKAIDISEPLIQETRTRVLKIIKNFIGEVPNAVKTEVEKQIIVANFFEYIKFES